MKDWARGSDHDACSIEDDDGSDVFVLRETLDGSLYLGRGWDSDGGGGMRRMMMAIRKCGG